MSFRDPWLLAALLALPLLAWQRRRALQARARGRAQLAAAGLVSVEAPVGRPRWRAVRRHLPFALALSALGLLVLGAARPMAALGLPERRGTVVLAFDTSNSMLATDALPTRLAVAQQAARRLVDAQPEEIRFGVVSFGDGAVVVQAPTDDRVAVLDAVDRLGTGGGTSLGQGVFAALGAIAGKPLAIDPAALSSEVEKVDIGYFGSASIIVFSDGENTGTPEPATVADLATLAGTTIHTVGVGEAAGTVLNLEGFNIATRLDVAALTGLAERTGGTYLAAADEAALRDLPRSLDLAIVRDPDPTEVTAAAVLAAAVLAVVAAALSLRTTGRVL
ncbi:MAG: VWA domain-containing protein [Acidimicrobiia bacterium]